MRDIQRNRVYSVEHSIFKPERQTYFRNLESVQKFINEVISSDYWVAKGGATKVDVFLGRRDSGTARAYAKGSRWRGKLMHNPFITLPPSWAVTKSVIVHELAHCLVGAGEKHGARFCAAYIDLCYQFVGGIEARKLAKGFEENNVKAAW